MEVVAVQSGGGVRLGAATQVQWRCSVCTRFASRPLCVAGNGVSHGSGIGGSLARAYADHPLTAALTPPQSVMAAGNDVTNRTLWGYLYGATTTYSYDSYVVWAQSTGLRGHACKNTFYKFIATLHTVLCNEVMWQMKTAIQVCKTYDPATVVYSADGVYMCRGTCAVCDGVYVCLYVCVCVCVVRARCPCILCSLRDTASHL